MKTHLLLGQMKEQQQSEPERIRTVIFYQNYKAFSRAGKEVSKHNRVQENDKKQEWEPTKSASHFE